MSFMSMEPINQTFQEMMSNSVKYQIPRFQRDYTWKQEQWEDLWSDIETLPMPLQGSNWRKKSPITKSGISYQLMNFKTGWQSKPLKLGRLTKY